MISVLLYPGPPIQKAPNAVLRPIPLIRPMAQRERLEALMLESRAAGLGGILKRLRLEEELPLTKHWSLDFDSTGRRNSVSTATRSGAFFFGLLIDRKSTRLNSSHLVISYAVFCLKKKKMPPVQLSLKRPSTGQESALGHLDST